MKAADIMTTKLVTIDSLATIAEAARIMQQHNIRALIVDHASDKDAYGIITETDISQVVANTRNPKETYVHEVMTKPCIVVNPDLAVEYIAKLFARAKIRVAPVIKDRLIGIVSLTDILTKTDCLTPTGAKLTSQKVEEFAEFPVDESIDPEGRIECDRSALSSADRIYEIWCSG